MVDAMRKMKESGIKWIGEIPDTWRVERGRYIFNYVQKPVREDDEVITCFRDGEVTLRSKRREEGFTISEKEIGYQGIDIGDLVIHGMDGFAGSIGISDSRGKASPVLNVLETGENKKFFMYYLRSAAWSGLFISLATGIRVRTCDTNWGKLKDIFYIIPNRKEQDRIVAYIDKQCAEIDALSADIQSEIDTLEAYKRSVITEAVTKGLDKNVKMKDSGIPWIGKVPEHWPIYRIADLYCDRNERGNDNLPLLTVSINSGVSDRELSEEEQERVFIRSEDKSKYKCVYPGDITYNMMRAWQGAFGAVRVKGMVSPAYVVAKQTGKAEIDSRYIEALLRSPMGIEEMNRYSYGIMDFRKRLYWPQFRIIKVCLPDIKEQKRIADYIDAKSEEINEIIGRKQKQIDMLADYKKSLIYEYVTGKKEVPA